MNKQLVTVGLLLSTLGFAGAAQSALITATASVTDLDTPSSFSFTFSTPIVPLTGQVSWTADVSGSLDDFARNGISMAPVGGSIYEFLINGVLLGTDSLGTLTADYSASYGGFYNCGSGCSSMELRFHFTGSGGKDLYSNIYGSLNATETSVSVPESGIAGLFLLGLVSLGVMRRFTPQRHSA